jgi:hypothetical protein
MTVNKEGGNPRKARIISRSGIEVDSLSTEAVLVGDRVLQNDPYNNTYLWTHVVLGL